jgi:hypothetical protein
MNPTFASEHLVEALERVRQYGAEHEPAGQAPPAFTVTISREAGANGTLIAELVGKQLGWAVYDHDLVERVAREMHLQPELLRGVDEKRPNWLAECLASFSQAPLVSDCG